MAFLAELEGPGGHNQEIHKARFAEMSDEEFDQLMEDIENGFTLPLVFPNFEGKGGIPADKIVKMAKKDGHEFFQQLRLTDAATGETYITPQKYMVIDLPVRRPSQTLSKKLSTAENNSKVDDLTDQPTGESKASSMSFPEVNVLDSLGLTQVTIEYMKGRGGDSKAFNKMNRDIIETGQSRMEDAIAEQGDVKSTETLSAILKGMHLNNNL